MKFEEYQISALKINPCLFSCARIPATNKRFVCKPPFRRMVEFSAFKKKQLNNHVHPYRTDITRNGFPGMPLKDSNLVDALRDSFCEEVLLHTGRDLVSVDEEFAEVLDELREDLGALYGGMNVTGRDEVFSRKIKKF